MTYPGYLSMILFDKIQFVNNLDVNQEEKSDCLWKLQLLKNSLK